MQEQAALTPRTEHSTLLQLPTDTNARTNKQQKDASRNRILFCEITRYLTNAEKPVNYFYEYPSIINATYRT